MAKSKDGARLPSTRAKKSTAVVPMARRKDAILRIENQDDDGAVFRQGEVTLVVGRSYRMGDCDVVVDAAYYVDGGGAPRAAELGGADKVA